MSKVNKIYIIPLFCLCMDKINVLVHKHNQFAIFLFSISGHRNNIIFLMLSSHGITLQATTEIKCTGGVAFEWNTIDEMGSSPTMSFQGTEFRLAKKHTETCLLLVQAACPVYWRIE